MKKRLIIFCLAILSTSAHLDGMKKTRKKKRRNSLRSIKAPPHGFGGQLKIVGEKEEELIPFGICWINDDVISALTLWSSNNRPKPELLLIKKLSSDRILIKKSSTRDSTFKEITSHENLNKTERKILLALHKKIDEFSERDKVTFGIDRSQFPKKVLVQALRASRKTGFVTNGIDYQVENLELGSPKISFWITASRIKQSSKFKTVAPTTRKPKRRRDSTDKFLRTFLKELAEDIVEEEKKKERERREKERKKLERQQKASMEKSWEKQNKWSSLEDSDDNDDDDELKGEMPGVQKITGEESDSSCSEEEEEGPPTPDNKYKDAESGDEW